MEETGSALETIGAMLDEIEKQQKEDVIGKILDEDLQACNVNLPWDLSASSCQYTELTDECGRTPLSR